MPLTIEFEITHQPWIRRARCRGAWEEPGWDPDGKTLHADPVVQEFCNKCDVRKQCLLWALAHDEHGVWGGTTRAERDRIKRGISRATCPVCTSAHIRRHHPTPAHMEICMSCGMSWELKR